MTADTRILGTPLSVGAITTGLTAVCGFPDSIEGYTIVQAIGHGGMGSVFEVCHKALGKRFALKLLSDSLRENSEAVDRFRSEILALGKLEHPNIVSAVDAGVWQGRPYLVTELLKGQDLAHRVIEGGKLDAETVISIAGQLASALNFAHQHGYFHRDIKPSNIFYQPDGSAKLLDFGLVRSESNHSLTRAGCFMGTVDFVAPEQAGDAARAGVASDIYSLGCTLIYLLSGDVPFPDSRYPTLTAKIAAHLQEAPDWLTNGTEDQPVWLVELIRATVAKSPNHRPVSCQTIHACLASRSFPAKKPLEKDNSKKTSFSGQKLAIGSGIAVAIATGCWSLLGSLQPVSPAASKTTSNHSTTSSVTSDVGAEHSPDTKSTDESVNKDYSIENTLPVSTTHNARGAQLSKQRIGSISPSTMSKKDSGDE